MSIGGNLREIGLNEKEVTIYMALLKHGRKTPAQLSQFTKINRATVYSVGKSLQSKGLVAEDWSGRSRYFVVLPPKNLGQLTDTARRELKEREDLVEKTIQELQLLTAEKEYPIPKIRFVQERDLKDFLFGNTVKWQKSSMLRDGIWWGFQDPSFVDHYESWIHATWTTAESKKPEFKSQVISNVSNVEQKLKKKYSNLKREVRTMTGINFTSSLWVAGDYVVMLMTQHHPFYVVELHDELLAHNIREMFKKLWQSALP